MDVKEIRKSLKSKLGYNARMVSVSQKHSNIVFTIRNEAVDYKKVKDFSLSFEDISRDEATGCILRGGNTFSRVDFSDQVKESLTNKHLAAVKSAIARNKDDYLEDVEGTNYMINRHYNGGITLYSKQDDHGSHVTECYDAKTVAFNIAIGR